MEKRRRDLEAVYYINATSLDMDWLMDENGERALSFAKVTLLCGLFVQFRWLRNRRYPQQQQLAPVIYRPADKKCYNL